MLYKVFKFSFVFNLLLVFSIQAQPRIWNMGSIENAKLVQSEASKYVIRSADKEIDKTIPSVVSKKTIPPSGDKHDYLSQGRYWWPNPNTADGLPYIRKDGVVNPEIEDFDRGALSVMASSIVNLSLAYYFTNDSKYANKAIDNLQIWFVNKNTKMNPNMNFGQTIPGKLDGKGRGEGVLDTYSFVAMLDGVELLKSSKRYQKNVHPALQEWFTTYLNWLSTSEIANDERNAKNNHGTAFDVQFVRYALFVGNDKLAKEIIEKFPAKRLFTQIEPNGAQPYELARTTALGYSVFNLTHFIDMCHMAKTLNIDLYNSTSNDGRSITKSIEFLLTFIGKPQSEFPYKQIKDWEKVQYNLRWQLYRADKLSLNNSYLNYYKSFINPKEKSNYIILY